MGRLCSLVALLRVVLVAIGLCLAGAAHPATAAADPGDARPDHCAGVDLPAPGPLLTEERDGDRRIQPADDVTTAPPRTLAFASASSRRIVGARGPPVDPRAPSGRPRSSRGPPDQV